MAITQPRFAPERTSFAAPPATEAPGSRIVDIRGHSRFVTLMKVSLPLLALALVALVIAWPRLQAPDNRFQVGFAAIKAREAENPSMMNARYVGTDDKDQPYSVTADMARNVLDPKVPVELEMPKADLGLNDGTWLALTAETGLYQRGDRNLDLVGGVNLFHDSGYEIRTDKVHVDLSRGTAESAEPVVGHGPFGELKGEGFALDKEARVLNLIGRAQVIIFPQGETGQPPRPADAGVAAKTAPAKGKAAPAAGAKAPPPGR